MTYKKKGYSKHGGSKGRMDRRTKCGIKECKKPRACNTVLCLYHLAKREYLAKAVLQEYDTFVKGESKRLTGRGFMGKITPHGANKK